MFDPLYRSLVPVALLITAGLLTLAVFPHGVGSPQMEYVASGLVFGTVLGHTTLAGLWTVMGPLSIGLRFPLSLAWLAALLLAFSLNLFLWEFGSIDIEDIERLGTGILLLGGWLVGQWVVVQLLTWCVMYGFRLRFAHLSELRNKDDRSQPQFEILHLLLITAIVATIFEAGRECAVRLIATEQVRGAGADFAFRAYLTLVGLLMTIPLAASLLLLRRAVPASLLVLLLIALGVRLQSPLLSVFFGGAGSDNTEPAFIYGIFGIHTAWGLTVLTSLRLAGFRLVRAPIPRTIQKF